MRWLLALIMTLALCGAAVASNYVCGDATKLGYYAQGVDPSAIPACAPPFHRGTAGVPEAAIPAQTPLYNTVVHRHLKVVAGLMVEMTQAEKDAVDAPINQKKEATDIANNEIKTNEVCANNTLTEITAYWKGAGGKAGTSSRRQLAPWTRPLRRSPSGPPRRPSRQPAMPWWRP